ncbi:MAG: hypothetical protein H7A24_00500 [Leptospiraceae bacterium]|nr:hypothetical protein [Leptospiraceae bacterium]MCP5510332.1 hypothetical protein [Leptospiraceae bacterium]
MRLEIKITYLFLFFLLLTSLRADGFSFQEGDLVFIETNTSQGKAIRLATDSLYNHVAIAIKFRRKLFLYEVASRVRKTEIREFINKSIRRRYTVKRLDSSETLFTEENKEKFRNTASTFLGKPRDLYFSWEDGKYYPAELVWKIFKSAFEMEICSTQKMKDLDWENPYVRMIFQQRFGKEIPYEETFVTPAMIFESKSLQTVYTNDERALELLNQPKSTSKPPPNTEKTKTIDSIQINPQKSTSREEEKTEDSDNPGESPKENSVSDEKTDENLNPKMNMEKKSGIDLESEKNSSEEVEDQNPLPKDSESNEEKR